ncbi:MAG: cysteine--tRNA ligase [Acholeplasmataceae bacterium]|nr:cysteine--tRNA ligase [Acholeplasmataceae bacterium]
MLHIYNSLTQSIEPFESIKPKRVSMYICGPTVYGDIHLGNARPIIFFDVFKRYLSHQGYDVLLVSNITDVDDKIIDKAKIENISEEEVSKTYLLRFIEMTQALNSALPDMMPKATEYVHQMIDYIDELIEKEYAYIRPSGVYFRVSKVASYGILSKQQIDELSQGVRITLEDDKEDPRDFSVWKNTEDGLRYPSPWGHGRPGWHTECAVMNHEIFDGEIDIHGGGTDLKFPHHENEIAQACAHDHHQIARYWMHVGRLDINQTKMSKSLGNVELVKDLIKAYDPLAFRLLMIAHHYRMPINYSNDLMEQFSKEYDKIKRSLKKAFLTISLSKAFSFELDRSFMDTFYQLMDDDLNTPNVITLIYDLLKAMNKEKDVNRLAVLYQTTKTILDILGIMPRYELTDDTLSLYKAWEQARSEKDYTRADRIREQLSQRGWMSF